MQVSLVKIILKKILEILYSEVEKVLKLHFTIENNYGSNFLNFKDYNKKVC